MRKICFYIVKNSQDNPKKIFFKTNKNSLLNLRNNKIYFDSKYHESEEIKVLYKYVSFNEKTYDDLILLLENAKKQAENIGKDSIGEEKEKNGSHAVIYSSIYKASYETPKSIFTFCSRIFIYLLMGHKLENGNKRLSLLFLRGVLRYFGYHFFWTAGLRTEYAHYKIKLVEIVEKLEKGHNDSDIIEIANWIKEKSVIALEWRN